jgi:hypothetical protein
MKNQKIPLHSLGLEKMKFNRLISSPTKNKLILKVMKNWEEMCANFFHSLFTL